jgi:hypothetical protein
VLKGELPIWRTKNQARDPRYSSPTQGFNLLQISSNWFLGNWTLDTGLSSGPKTTRGLSHCGLAIYIKTYLKAKEELWKLKYFTMRNYNLQKISSKTNPNSSRYYNPITNLKSQHKPKYHLSNNPHIKIYRPIIIYYLVGAKIS